MHCVLSNLMKYLNMKDLKRVRNVNSIWNAEAATELKKKSIVRFKLEIADEKTVCTSVENVGAFLSKFSTYLDQMKQFNNENYSIIMTRKFPYTAAPLSTFTFTKFFEQFGQSVKYFELICEKMTGWNFHLLLQETLNFKFAQLKHLVLNIQCPDTMTEFNWDNCSLEKLSTVKHFDLTISGFCNHFALAEKFRLIAKTVLQIVPNLISLSINSGNDGCHFNIDSVFANEIYNNLESLKKLTSISIKAKSFPSPEMLNKIPPNLTKLELLIPKECQATQLEKLFKNQEGTLIELYLIIPTVKIKESDHGQFKPQQIQIPTFPKLKTFTIEHIEHDHSGEPRADLKLIFDWKFVGGDLNYERQFPMLEELNLGKNRYYYNNMHAWRMYEPFFPRNDQVVPKVRKLNFAEIHVRALDSRLKDQAEDFLTRIDDMFPNMENPCVPILELRMKKLLNNEGIANRFFR